MLQCLPLSYAGTLVGMTTERVTVSLPAELRQVVQRVADDAGVPFSSLVSGALTAWVRGRLVDEWLAEYQAERGVFDEDELRALAGRAGIAYLPPGRPATASL